jgi:hypothetical protein
MSWSDGRLEALPCVDELQDAELTWLVRRKLGFVYGGDEGSVAACNCKYVELDRVPDAKGYCKNALVDDTFYVFADGRDETLRRLRKHADEGTPIVLSVVSPSSGKTRLVGWGTVLAADAGEGVLHLDRYIRFDVGSAVQARFAGRAWPSTAARQPVFVSTERKGVRDVEADGGSAGGDGGGGGAGGDGGSAGAAAGVVAKRTRIGASWFDSKLEAQHVHFVTRGLGMTYQSTPRAFACEEGRTWTIDGYIPDIDAYVEIKPTDPYVDEHMRCERASTQTKSRVVLLYGAMRLPYQRAPSYVESGGTYARPTPGVRGIEFDAKTGARRHVVWTERDGAFDLREVGALDVDVAWRTPALVAAYEAAAAFAGDEQRAGGA